MNDQKENEVLEQEAVAAEVPEEAGAPSAEEIVVSQTSEEEGEKKKGKKKDKKGKKKDKKKDKKKGKKKGKKK